MQRDEWAGDGTRTSLCLGNSHSPDTKPTHQPCTVVTREVLVADLHQAPKGLLRRTSTGAGDENQAEKPPTSTKRPPSPSARAQGADLSRHVHEQHGGHRGLGLAVALVGPVDGVSLQDSV